MNYEPTKLAPLVDRLSILLMCLLAACTSGTPPAPPVTTTASTDSSSDDSDDDLLTSDDDDDSSDDDDDDEDDEAEEDEDDDNEDEEDAFEALLHADKLKECHDDKKVYDRRTADGDDEGDCHEAKWPAKFTCDKAGVIKAFGSSQKIKDYVAKQQEDGFKLDQCGEYSSGKPIVFYIKKDGEDGEAQLRVRVVEPSS